MHAYMHAARQPFVRTASSPPRSAVAQDTVYMAVVARPGLTVWGSFQAASGRRRCVCRRRAAMYTHAWYQDISTAAVYQHSSSGSIAAQQHSGVEV